MKLVIIESPYAGQITRNIQYAKRAMIDCLKRNEAPIASHLLYTQILDDTNPEERQLGIIAGLEWGTKADATVVYVDYGTSPGMVQGILNAVDNHREIEYRYIGRNSLDDAYDEPVESNYHVCRLSGFGAPGDKCPECEKLSRNEGEK